MDDKTALGFCPRDDNKIEAANRRLFSRNDDEAAVDDLDGLEIESESPSGPLDDLDEVLMASSTSIEGSSTASDQPPFYNLEATERYVVKAVPKSVIQELEKEVKNAAAAVDNLEAVVTTTEVPISSTEAVEEAAKVEEALSSSEEEIAVNATQNVTANEEKEASGDSAAEAAGKNKTELEIPSFRYS